MGLFSKKKIQEIIDECEEIKFDIKSHTVCFTGHRSQKLPWGFNENDPRCVIMKKKLKEIIEKAILDGYDRFITGMALGFDMICAEIVLELKKKYKHIKLIGALPCENQDCKWPIQEQKRYRKLREKLDCIRCIYDTYIGPECMLERNRYMINNSSMLIALFNGQNGGTKSTIEYAKKKCLEIVIIKP